MPASVAHTGTSLALLNPLTRPKTSRAIISFHTRMANIRCLRLAGSRGAAGAVSRFLSRAISRSHGLTVKETAFESLPLHVVVVVVVPSIELEDVPPSGGLSTRTCNVPGCAMSAAGIVATN